MTLTKESIQRMKEDDFTREVLVPLFRAMEYRDVRFHGGGILEQGKDLTMWREHAVRGRTNYAAVVKATPVTGEAATAMVIGQLRQAFAHPFRDGATGDAQRVHECFVITSWPMKKEAFFTLQNVIDAEPFSRYVTLLDGDAIWDLCTEHLGSRATLGVLLETYRRLREQSNYSVDVALSEKGAHLSLRGRNGEELTPPTFQFPDTPEGQANQAAYDTFVRTGSPVNLDLAGVEVIREPGALAEFGAPRDGTLRLSRKRAPSLFGELRFRGSSGEVAAIPGLEFTAAGGTEVLTLTNERQNVPLHFSFKISFDESRPEASSAEFNVDVKLVGWSIHWYVLYLKVLRAVKDTAVATLRDVQTGIEHTLGVLNGNNLTLPPPEHMDLAERVLWIQNRTKQPILLPDREFFTNDDRENIEFVETVIKKGRQTVNSMRLELEANPAAGVDWRAQFDRGIKNVHVQATEVSRLVLDTHVPLGPMEVVCTNGRMSVDDVDAAVAGVEAGGAVPVTILPVGSGRITASYPRWRKR